jgi:hypothetical protein
MGAAGFLIVIPQDFFYIVNMKYCRGQIGVIILLIMAVLLTVGLTLAANSNKDLIISQQEEESGRVFNAAEAGIEKALSSDLTFAAQSLAGTVDSIANVGVNYDINKLHALQTRLLEGMSVNIDVTGVADGQGLAIDWSKEDNCATQDPASLLIGIFTDDAGTLKVRYLTAGACDRGDGFDLGASGDFNGFRRRITIPLAAGDQFARIKTLYNDTHLLVAGSGWTLPVQGFAIRSEAKNELGNETRAVEVTRSLPGAPAVMDYALVSGSDISK